MISDERVQQVCKRWGIEFEEGRRRADKIDQAEKDGQSICFLCARTPSEVPVYVELATDENKDVDEWVEENEGTFNREVRRFACDECYIKIGMPSSLRGWVAP